MSILWTLRKHIDAVQQREEDAERRKAREVPHTIRQEGGGTRRQPTPAPEVLQSYRCRVCGHEAKVSQYCSVCLADTMEPLAATEQG